MIKNISFRYRSLTSENFQTVADFIKIAGELGCIGLTSLDTGGECSVNLKKIPADEEYRMSELVIVFGGDGTIIKTAREFAPHGTPVLGVNTGHLGYLAELSPVDYKCIERVISGDFITDDRMMLDVRIDKAGVSVCPERPALNDAIIANGPVSRLLSYDLYCDGVLVQSCRADGIIIATPTGSTAYSMSAGGPIADPTLECVIATPICPHSLYQRPTIYGRESELELSSISCREGSVYLTLDGAEVFPITPEDKIVIKRSDVRARLVRLKKRSFLEVLHEKMS